LGYNKECQGYIWFSSWLQSRLKASLVLTDEDPKSQPSHHLETTVIQDIQILLEVEEKSAFAKELTGA
jgi:hypothetical protein